MGQKRSASSIEVLLKDLYSAAAHGVHSMSSETVSLYANDIDGTISSPGAYQGQGHGQGQGQGLCRAYQEP